MVPRLALVLTMAIHGTVAGWQRDGMPRSADLRRSPSTTRTL